MALILFRIVKQIYTRWRISQSISRFKQLKVNGIRKKYRLNAQFSYWDTICEVMCFPFALIFGLIYDLYERITSSVGTRAQTYQRKGHMRRVFKNYTQENQKFRKVVYFSFGLILTYLSFVFLYYQNVLTNYSLMFATIALLILFTLIAPFKQIVLCLILIGLPSLFSNKVRYVLVAYILYAIYFNVMPNIWANGVDTLRAFGCTISHTSAGGKHLGGFVIKDIKDKLMAIRNDTQNMITKMNDFMKKYLIAVNIPINHLKNFCKRKDDKDIYECEDYLTMFKIEQIGRFYMPLVCKSFIAGMADMCDTTKQSIKQLVNQTKQKVIKTIEDMIRDVYFDIDLNHEFNYHSNQSLDFRDVFRAIGSGFMERNSYLTYFAYLLNLRVLILIVITLWVFINSVVYLFRFLKSDPFDNVYIDEDLLEIDEKRSEVGKETIIPLDINERKIFISTFDLMMTSSEWMRFLLGLILFAVTLSQVIIYFAMDLFWYYLMIASNQLLDSLTEMFAPAAIRVNFEGEGFLAKRLNRLNDGLDIKQKISDQLQKCKPIPQTPNQFIYKQIAVYLVLIFFTIICGTYGLRLRHYVAGLFYPHRVPIRAVWLYNNILSRRGNIFQFLRRQMRQKIMGENGENISLLDRLCAQSSIFRIIFTLLGLYGKHKYCVKCGQKVKPDGSDQSVECANRCGARYCFQCLSEQNNMCSVCMAPIDYAQLGAMSEELDSSDEDIAYNLNNKDFLYQYEERSDREEDSHITPNDVFDPIDLQRRDLISMAYEYDSVDRVPSVVYIVDEDRGYEADNEGFDESEDYNQYMFQLEQELKIPAEEILKMKRNAQTLVGEDLSDNIIFSAKEEKYSILKREEDQRILRNAMVLMNKDIEENKTQKQK